MSTEPSPPSAPELAGSLARLEQRLARIEQHLGLETPSATPAPPPSASAPSTAVVAAPAEDFEMVVGQNWFARVGVFVLVCGAGVALSLPYAGLPPAVPGLIGMLLATGLLLAGHLGRALVQGMAGHCRAAGMVLLYLGVLRLFYFGSTPALATSGLGGQGLLVAVVGVNLLLVWHQRSLPLVILALGAGYLTAALVGTSWFVFLLVAGLIAVAVQMANRQVWPVLLLLASFGAFATHLYWALGRPWYGRAVHFVTEPGPGLYAVLVYVALLALGPLTRKDRDTEDPVTVLVAFLSCSLGYVVLLMHTLAAFNVMLPLVHAVAAVVLLALAATHWHREKSHVSTFFYAMTGYLALSVVIIKIFPRPEVFLWLSLQSLVVVATALWFRSRFIVVANFLIYVLIVAGYIFVAKGEQGISLGFGVVALVTARILNWQRDRLELRTDFMRNAYLASAFVIFPYALYHLVPRTYVSLSWVGLALVYYLLNLIVRNRKYRWMGHSTLLLTVGYVLLFGLTQLAPVYRILSFVVLGAVLLVVSMIFARARQRSGPPGPGKDGAKLQS